MFCSSFLWRVALVGSCVLALRSGFLRRGARVAGWWPGTGLASCEPRAGRHSVPSAAAFFVLLGLHACGLPPFSQLFLAAFVAASLL